MKSVQQHKDVKSSQWLFILKMEAIAYICQNLKESYRCKQPHSYMFNGKTLLLATSKRFTVCKNIYSLHVLSSFPSTATKTYNHETLTDLKQAAFPCLPFNFFFFSFFLTKMCRKRHLLKLLRSLGLTDKDVAVLVIPRKTGFI